jgi:lipopolysaccharide export system permease protein
VAQSGKMTISPDKKFLEFNLKNGWDYQEKGPRSSMNTQLIRMGFEDYKKVFDLSSFKLTKTDDSAFKNNYQMLNMRQLSTTIDSLEKTTGSYRNKSQTMMNSHIQILSYLDSPWKAQPPKTFKKDSFSRVLPDSTLQSVLLSSLSTINLIKGNLENSVLTYESDRTNLRMHLMVWHEKITMSIACLVLFMIGAPLGSIIRKGGIGLPLIFAVIFFVIFFLLNNFGRKFVKQDVMQPVAGMWMATFVLLPVGIFLTYKAMADSQLFNKEFYYRVLKKFRKGNRKENDI